MVRVAGRICSIEGCKRKLYARGWCSRHYQRWARFGDPSAGGARFENPWDSIQERTEWAGDCLVWTGSISSTGRGIVRRNGKSVNVHVFVWEEANGPTPEGRVIDHSCRNEKCVRLSHLRVATRGQNNSNLSGARKDSGTGVRNVSQLPSGNYRVVVRNRSFGTYPSLEEARAVAEKARYELFGEFAGKG